jgi:hypothetical protein
LVVAGCWKIGSSVRSCHVIKKSRNRWVHVRLRDMYMDKEITPSSIVLSFYENYWLNLWSPYLKSGVFVIWLEFCRKFHLYSLRSEKTLNEQFRKINLLFLTSQPAHPVVTARWPDPHPHPTLTRKHTFILKCIFNTNSYFKRKYVFTHKIFP